MVKTDDVAPDAEGLRKVVEHHFRVYDVREENAEGQWIAGLYYIMFEEGQFDARFEALRDELRAVDERLMVFLRREGGEDILFVTSKPPSAPIRNRANVVLLILTFITTAMAGAVYWYGYAHAGESWRWSVLWDPASLGWGALTFSLPLMFILGVHETAHFIAARRHGLRATLPYFLPVPPMILPIGTLGAFISLKDPMPDRKALFDVGASGPLAGFIVAVPLLVLGAALTGGAFGAEAQEVPDLDRPVIIADGFTVEHGGPGDAALVWDGAATGPLVLEVVSPADDWTFEAEAVIRQGEASLADGIEQTLGDGERYLWTIDVPIDSTEVTLDVTWDDHLIQFGDPLLVQGLETFFDNDDYLTHPTFFAAWVGILVTGINLLPAGQLDGGHVARAVLGERVRWAAMASLALLMFLAFRFSTWILMALFLVLTGLYHPPPLNDRTRLDGRRKLVAALVLAVFAVTFIPVPIQI